MVLLSSDVVRRLSPRSTCCSPGSGESLPGGPGDVVTEYYWRIYAPVARRMAQLLGAKMLRIKQLMGVYASHHGGGGGGAGGPPHGGGGVVAPGPPVVTDIVVGDSEEHQHGAVEAEGGRGTLFSPKKYLRLKIKNKKLI